MSPKERQDIEKWLDNCAEITKTALIQQGYMWAKRITLKYELPEEVWKDLENK